MSIHDLYECLHLENKGDPSLTLHQLNELKETIQKSPYIFISKVEDFIRAKSEQCNICPRCYTELHTKTENNETTEYQGMEVSEPVHSKYCANGCNIDY